MDCGRMQELEWDCIFGMEPESPLSKSYVNASVKLTVSYKYACSPERFTSSSLPLGLKVT